MYSYKIFMVNAQIKRIELWQDDGRRRPFRKIMLEAVSYGRFYTSTNFSGRNPLAIEGLTVSKSIDKAVEGFEPEFVARCIKIFGLANPTAEEIVEIFPGALLTLS